MLRGDVEPGFTIDLAHKDLSIIIAAANTKRVPLSVAAAAREMFSLARAAGYGADRRLAMRGDRDRQAARARGLETSVSNGPAEA